MEKMMKIWLDDTNTTPDDSWTWAPNVISAEALIYATGRMKGDRLMPNVEALSMNSDAGKGEDETFTAAGVIKWLMAKKWSVPVFVHAGSEETKAVVEEMIRQYQEE